MEQYNNNYTNNTNHDGVLYWTALLSITRTASITISFVPSTLTAMQITVMARVNMAEWPTGQTNIVIYDMDATTATYSFQNLFVHN